VLTWLDESPWKLGTDASLSRGCTVDANVLFAAFFPLDAQNEGASKDQYIPKMID
jgi:hypothetical protein